MNKGKVRAATFAVTPAGQDYEVRAWWEEWEEGYGWVAHRSFLAAVKATELVELRRQLADGWTEV